jgi:YcaO-like protein with predicted kinase domain
VSLRLAESPTRRVPDSPAVAAYRQLAAQDGFTAEFDLSPLDVTGVPVWNVSVWDRDCTGWENGIGYGEPVERARIGAWGELVEFSAGHVACARLRRTTASYNDLLRRGTRAVDPLTLRLPVGTAYTPDTPVVWLPGRVYDAAKPWAEHADILVPIEAVASNFYDLGDDFPHTPLYTPVSNGSGAGDTPERALCHALLELVQRDGNSAGYRAVDRGVRIELDAVRDIETRALLARLEAAGIDVLVKLADTNLGMTNLYVVGRERDLSRVPHPLMLTGCGEAAHPDREVALKKAVQEYCASRARKAFVHGPIEPLADLGLLPDGYLGHVERLPPGVEESRSFREMRRWAHLDAEDVLRRIRGSVLKAESVVAYSSLPTVEHRSLKSPADELAVVARRFADEGLDIVYVDLLPPDAPAKAIKAVVGRMEVETLTYYRVGPRNVRRLIDRGFDFVGLGTPPADRPHAKAVPLDEAAVAQLGGPAWMDVAGVDAVTNDLYALYREPEAHVIALADRRDAQRPVRPHAGGN